MPEREQLPERLDQGPDEALHDLMRQDESMAAEVLRHRRMERALRSMLSPGTRRQRIRDSIIAAVGGTPLENLREQVLAKTSRPRIIWRTHRLAWAAGAAAMLCLAALMMFPGNPNALQFAGSVEGTELRRDGKNRAAASGMTVKAGDEVHAGSRGVTLRFTQEGTMITLEPDTTMRVRSLAPQKQFELLQGGLEADVAKQPNGAMLWTTDNAEARVLGTRFALTADGVFTRLDVQKGAVELQRLGTPEQTVVRSGEFAAADARKLTVARPQSAEPVWNVADRSTPGFEHVSFTSEAAGMEMGVNVLLPPMYSKHAGRRYPVVYFLHDSGGDEHGDAARFGPLMRESMTRLELPPFIAVFPNVGPGHTPKPWIMGKALARDLTRFVDDRYRTIPFRRMRIVAGIGQGGHRALMLAALQGMEFSSCVVMDDPLRGGPPGFRILLERAQAHLNRFGSQALLLHSRSEPERDVVTLAQFLNDVGMDARFATMKSESPDHADFAAEAWARLVPEIANQWAR